MKNTIKSIREIQFYLDDKKEKTILRIEKLSKSENPNYKLLDTLNRDVERIGNSQQQLSELEITK